MGFHGDSYICSPMTDRDGKALLMTYDPTGVTGFKAKLSLAFRN